MELKNLYHIQKVNNIYVFLFQFLIKINGIVPKLKNKQTYINKTVNGYKLKFIN